MTEQSKVTNNFAYRDAYSALLDLFFRMIVARQNSSMGFFSFQEPETLAIKIFQHLLSADRVQSGDVYENAGHSISIVDIASLSVIVRGALETYLVLSRVFGKKDKSVQEFRHLAWLLGGRIDLQKYADVGPEAAAIQLKQDEIVADLRAKLESCVGYANLNSKVQRRLMAGEWRADWQWVDAACEAGFHRTYFTNMYRFICGYSHSSSLATQQIAQAVIDEEGTQLISNTLMSYGLVTLAYAVRFYADLYDHARTVLMADKSSENLVTQWRIDQRRWDVMLAKRID